MSTSAVDFKLKLSAESILAIYSITLVSIFILLNFFMPFNWWIYLVCLGLAGLLILKAPEVGLYTIIFCTIIFERWFTLQPFEWSGGLLKLYPLDVIIIFTLLSFLAYWAVRPGRPRLVLRDRLFGWSLLLWVGVISVYFIAALISGQADSALAFSTFKNFALYFIIYLLTINIIRTDQQFKRFFATFLCAGVGLLYFIVYGFVSGQGLWSEFVPLSTPGSRLLGGPHSFFVAMMIVMFGNLLIWRYRRSLRDYSSLLLIAVFLLGIIGSLQRHLWLALLLAVAILLYWYQPKQRRHFGHLLALGVVVVLIVASLSLWAYSWRASTILPDSGLLQSTKFRLFSLVTTDGADSSAVWRLASWYRAWEVFGDHWLTGIGLGETISFAIGELDFTVEVRELHNDFIGLAVQLGVMGIFVGLSLLYRYLRGFVSAYRRCSAAYRPYLLTFFALAAMFLWSANFGTYFDTNMLVIFFWFFLAGMSVSARLGEG
ncbi:O-antigen ligase family protein [Candidatus Falkowbacteria bacterium]|nr:O-antigen ligase family protein [Candidatus Falkowbacteria bacterium]